MSYKNKKRLKQASYGTCNYCGLNIWHRGHAKKWQCCSRNCLDSFEILIGKQDHELAKELRWKHKKYGGSIYTTIRWIRLRRFILKRDGRCLKCGATENLHVDHILPISHGKGHYWDFKNLQTLCGRCNIEKGVKKVSYLPKEPFPIVVVNRRRRRQTDLIDGCKEIFSRYLTDAIKNNFYGIHRFNKLD